MFQVLYLNAKKVVILRRVFDIIALINKLLGTLG